MRILLDTNILIPLEDSSKALHDSFSEFVRLAHSNEHSLLVHPSSRDDIERDRDITRREISLSRFKKYSLLSPPPAPPTEDELASYHLKQDDENDRVDNEILFSIFRDAANILITEDRGLHRKASRMGLSSRVHYLQQAVAFLRRLHAVIPISLPNIEEVPLYQLDLNDPFFDSLREDYDGFNEWYQKKARDGRRAWIHRDSLGKMGAVCIFHIENDPILTDDHRSIPGKVLKLCTFKVGESVRGRRVGELFLKAAFRYAFENKIEHIYLHTRAEKQEFLIDFCREFGFFHFGEYKNDAVYVKKHPHEPPIDVSAAPVEYHRKFFPHFMAGTVIAKYIIPIKPKYHKILFPDGQVQSLLPFGNAGTGQVVGNAIRQAYLCHARIGGIIPGDIVLFYRSKDQKSITSVGVIEKVGDYSSFEDIVQIVSKRTVYSHKEIGEMAKKKTKVILFRLVQHLLEPISINWLEKNGLVKGPIQTIRRIENESFVEIIKKGGITNCLLAD